MAVLLPATLRARQSAPLSATQRFKRRMRLIAPRTPRRGRWVVVPESTARLAKASFKKDQRRRKLILQGLLVAVVSSLIAALARGGGMWELHLATDASLVFYVALLLEAKRRRTERATKVASMQDRTRGSAPRTLVDMTAEGSS